jgi:hypothetical protein
VDGFKGLFKGLKYIKDGSLPSPNVTSKVPRHSLYAFGIHLENEAPLTYLTNVEVPRHYKRWISKHATIVVKMGKLGRRRIGGKWKMAKK